MCCKGTISRVSLLIGCATATATACYLLFVCVTQTERSMLFYPIRCNGRQTNGLYLNKIWKHLSMCTFRLTKWAKRINAQWKSVFLTLLCWTVRWAIERPFDPTTLFAQFQYRLFRTNNWHSRGVFVFPQRFKFHCKLERKHTHQLGQYMCVCVEEYDAIVCNANHLHVARIISNKLWK